MRIPGIRRGRQDHRGSQISAQKLPALPYTGIHHGYGQTLPRSGNRKRERPDVLRIEARFPAEKEPLRYDPAPWTGWQCTSTEIRSDKRYVQIRSSFCYLPANTATVRASISVMRGSSAGIPSCRIPSEVEAT